MLANPLSQIERTKDAYAGNMQGLEKRANMTKELVDLLAMQQLKKDLDAVKRNQAMQAQGNPTTIKDQMQQGLMGEYRQQAAKEMGVGPSEMDTVNRAQQGMPQGGPRMPQGAPQQMPQQPQGVMSQARPVQLAGGGIVAFYGGGPISEITDEDVEAYIAKNPFMENKPEALVKQQMYNDARGGSSAVARLFSALGPEDSTPERTTRGERKQRSERGEEPSAEPTGNAETRRNFDTSGLQAQVDAEYDRQGLANPKYAPPPNVAQQEEERETRRSEAQQRAEQREKEEYGASLQGQLDAVKTSGIAAGLSPYQLDQTQRDQAEGDIAKDPDAAGLAAIERLKKYSKMGENERLLEDMQKRVQATYDETAPSRRDNLIDLLTAGGRGGITGVGVRDRQLRDAATERRRQLDQDVMGIQATTIELNRNYGADAAKAYADAESTIINQKNNARNFLENANQAEQASLVEIAQLTMEEQRNIRQMYTEQERNRLLSEQITEGNLTSLSKSINDSLALNAAQVIAITEQVNEDPRYAEISALTTSTDFDDARKLKLLEGARDAEIMALTADLNKMSDALRVRQRRIQAMQNEQLSRTTPNENIDLGEVNALVENS